MWGSRASFPTLPLEALAGASDELDFDGSASASSLSSFFVCLPRFRGGIGAFSPEESDASVSVGSGRVLRVRRVRVIASQWVR
jgi:hypothetical protein